MSSSPHAASGDNGAELENLISNLSLSRAEHSSIPKAEYSAAPSLSTDSDAVETETVSEQELTEDVFQEYVPEKINVGPPHPDSVVETSTLASVSLPNVTYAPFGALNGARDATLAPSLSAVQYEVVTYAGQAHANENALRFGQRMGFFIGDGAGVGKGREISGIILDNHLNGRRRAVWISISADLYQDAKRDLGDTSSNSLAASQGIPVHDIRQFKQTEPITAGDGVLYSTYSMLTNSKRVEQVRRASTPCATCFLRTNLACGAGASRLNPLRHLLPAHQSGVWSRHHCSIKLGSFGNAQMGEGGSLLLGTQLLDWCGRGQFEGALCFDESHKAKNMKPEGAKGSSATAKAVMRLQREMPLARVVYCSATGASDIRQLCYMERLLLWGPGTCFASFEDFCAAMEKGGNGAREMLAMEMKMRGCYIARGLSFQGAECETVNAVLTERQRQLYDACATLWGALWSSIRATHNILPPQAAKLAAQRASASYWGGHQSFFNQLLLSFKVPTIVASAQQALAEGKCVVVALQSTGAAAAAAAASKEGADSEEAVSTPHEIISRVVEKQLQYPTPTVQSEEAAMEAQEWEMSPMGEALKRKREELLAEVAKLQLPATALDTLVAELGGASQVAEMTGRSKRERGLQRGKKVSCQALPLIARFSRLPVPSSCQA
ncbi:hypothetical protein CYMTET_25939, partial [Cymbomonas tetramitiformis]